MPRFKKSSTEEGYVEVGRFLTMEQAYHLWWLSHQKEGGYGLPIAPRPDMPQEGREGPQANPIRRIYSWFSDELQDEFEVHHRLGQTPLDVYENGFEPRQVQTISVTVNVPLEWKEQDIYGEIASVFNEVVEDTQLQVVLDERWVAE